MANVNTVTSSKDVKLHDLVIIGSNGETQDISSIYNVININEDMFAPVVSGSVQLIDGVGISSSLGLHGNEYLYISFSRPGEEGEGTRYKRTFRIYKISERKPAGKTQAQSYVVHFCSEELVFSNQLLVSKAFKGASCTEYVYRILTETLKANKKRVNTQNFEKSFGDAFHVLTTYKPFEAINYFTHYAFNENESTFAFFENKDGYNFMSLEKLFNRPILNKLNYNTAKLTKEQDVAPFANSNDINDFVFDHTFDVLDNTRKSAYSGKLYTLDIVTQKYREYKYSAVNQGNKKVMMDGYFPLNDAKNRNERSIYEEYDTEINYWLTNLGQTNNPYFISKNEKVPDINVERTLLQRKVQMNLLRSTSLKCIVPGNPFYSAGYMVEFDAPAFTKNLPNERVIDPYYSGKYLITGVRHMITPSDGLQTMLHLSKNSVAAAFDKSKTNEQYRTARNF